MTNNKNDENLKKDTDQILDKDNIEVQDSAQEEQVENTVNNSTTPELSTQELSTQELSTQELISVKEKLLRVNADFQNYKRRIEKEKMEWINVGQSKVIEAFLPFVDDLDLALGSCNRDELDEKTSALLEGFLIIQKKLKKNLEDLDIKEIDCSGQFDPSFHEALMQMDSKDHESGQIVQVFNPGYLFKDKVLRHAKVSVAK